MSARDRPVMRSALLSIPDGTAVMKATVVVVVTGWVLASVGGTAGLLFDDLQELAAALGGAAALLVASRDRAGRGQVLLLSLAVALAGAGAGMLAWDLAPDDASTLARVGDVVFLASVAVGAAAMLPAIFTGLAGDELAGVITDAIIIFLAGITALAAAWGGSIAATGDHIAPIGAAALLAIVGACVFALMTRRIAPSAGGPWALFAGASILGASWLMWIGDSSATSTVGPSDFLFAAGLLLIADGGVTWNTRRSASRTFERLARVSAAALPVGAIIGSLCATALMRPPGGIDAVGLSTGGVIVTSVVRQVMLYSREARAREAERRAGRLLADEIRERAATLLSLQRLLPCATVEETAQRVCGEALRLDGVDLAAVRAYADDGDVTPLAVEGLGPRGSDLVGRPFDPAEAKRERSLAMNGSWETQLNPGAPGHYLQVLREAGVQATVTAPLRWKDVLIGDISVGTRSTEHLAVLGDRLSTVEEFAVVAAALLGPPIVERDRIARLRGTIGTVIADRAFHPVFQPVVDLATGGVVGHEALTRFDDGTPPDRRFEDADRAGMGTALEMACLRAAVEAARSLPAGTWLSLNASPELATDLVGLIEALERLDRDVVIEITEHVQVADYAPLVEAIEALSRGHARFAVDDAGAGYAGLRHILEVRPQFVKLDIALVRGIDLDPARRAMVASMTLFARETGCELIAEGIETEDELAVLRDLGVTYGQGYLLGRPVRI